MCVSAEKFFEQIEKSISYDIEKSTGKKIIPYRGFKYKKIMQNKLGRKGDVEILIKDFKSPTIYIAEFKSINGINEISYDVKELGEDCIEVTYTESFNGNTKMLNVNFNFMNFFYKRRAKKRARKMLKSMESYIINY